MVNDAFTSRMEPQIRVLRDAELTVARILRQIGPSEAVSRFLSRYAKIRTQKAYAIHLQLYLARPFDSMSLSVTKVH